MTDHLLSIIDSTSEWAGKLFSFLVVPGFVIIVYGVIMRYGFNNPLTWGLELTIYLCAATYLVGGAYVHLHNGHVRMDVLYMRWSPRLKAIMDLVMFPVFFLSVGVLGWAGAEWTIKALVEGATSGSIWNPIIWPVRLLIPLGCFLLLLQGLAKFIRDFGLARDRKNRRETVYP